MSDCIVEVINSIPGIENLSYLELGSDQGVNFSNIKCKDKESVDVNGKATHTMTTKKFFAQNKRRFDIVFIDADHSSSAVVQDFNSSIEICNKYIFLHDMFPACEEHTAPRCCNDSYRVLHYMVNVRCVNVATLNTDSGLSFVNSPFTPIENLASIYPCNYKEFLGAMKKFKRYTVDEMKDLFKDNV